MGKYNQRPVLINSDRKIFKTWFGSKYSLTVASNIPKCARKWTIFKYVCVFIIRSDENQDQIKWYPYTSQGEEHNLELFYYHIS